jgi:hypothetical protein
MKYNNSKLAINMVELLSHLNWLIDMVPMEKKKIRDSISRLIITMNDITIENIPEVFKSEIIKILENTNDLFTEIAKENYKENEECDREAEKTIRIEIDELLFILETESINECKKNLLKQIESKY